MNEENTFKIVDNVGNTIKSLDTKQNDIVIESKGEEITNIIKYIIEEAKTENIEIEKAIAKMQEKIPVPLTKAPELLVLHYFLKVRPRINRDRYTSRPDWSISSWRCTMGSNWVMNRSLASWA